MAQTEETRHIVDNLEKWRVNHGMTQKDFSSKIGMTSANYTKLINGEISKIGSDTLKKVHDLTGLFMFQLIDCKRDAVMDLVDTITKLPPSSIRFLNGVANFELGLAEQKTSEEHFINVFIPTLNMHDGMIYDSSNVIRVDIGNYKQKFNGQIDCGIMITSNHLHNAYHAGDILLIKWDDPRDGDIAILLEKDTNRLFIRKFRQTNPVRLISITDRPNDIIVDPNDIDDMSKWVKFGIVVSKFREPLRNIETL